MSSGMTFYNKHGFYQKTFQDDFINYNIIINKNFYTSFNYILDNIDELSNIELSNIELDKIFYMINVIYKILKKIKENKNINRSYKIMIIKKCIEFVLNNLSLLLIEKSLSIKEVGIIIKNNRDNSDMIMYFKKIVLSIMEISFKYRWDKENDNGESLIKIL